MRIISQGHERNKLIGLIFALLLFHGYSMVLYGQIDPTHIRGYKVHKEKISITQSAMKPSEHHAVVSIGDPEATDLSLTGVELQFPVEIFSPGQSGKVDFLMFYEIRVNDVAVDIPEYTTKFEFKKDILFRLPEPAKVFLPTTRIVQAAWREMRDSRNEWTVTGRVFVFGKFRKYGFHHKRVVPIDFSLTIPNPLKK